MISFGFLNIAYGVFLFLFIYSSITYLVGDQIGIFNYTVAILFSF
jgi:hypothetical protein